MGPDFLVLGTQKAGTAWLHRNLAAHPDVWMAPEKELHFFDQRLDEPSSRLGRMVGRTTEAQRWRRQARRQVRLARQSPVDPGWRWQARLLFGADHRTSWYRAMFAPSGDRLAGESTPNYAILPPDVTARVRASFPDLRLVFLVRNPVERMWSQLDMVNRLAAGTATETPDSIVDRVDARAFGDYVTMLDAWGEVFGSERIWVGFMEDVADHPRAVLNAVTDHLGLVRHDRYPAAGRVVHRGGGAVLPIDAGRTLATALRDDVAAAADRLGGPARWWDFATRRLAAGDVDGDELPLPLSSSRLWDAWSAGPGRDDPTTMAGRTANRLPA